MDTVHQNEVDRCVRELCEQGDLQAAAGLMLARHGPDVLRIIHARFREADLSAEVFARFSEALWLALPRFDFRCSVRVFMFTLAKNAGSRFLARELRRERRAMPLSEAGPLAAQVNPVRTQTRNHLRTESKSRISRLRAALSHEDQLLLTLRIDRALEYREIALVMLEDPSASEPALKREAARLRKRLQLVKEQLRRLMQESE
jgi:DNA-directed RNA polymerase specialized sigma24 family protein